MAARRAPMPESVKIGPYEYRIVSSAEDHLAAEDYKGARLDGLSSALRATINVDPRAAEMYKRSTMVHELIHQVFEVAGWHPEEDVEEQVCRTLETVFLGTLRDNPDLVAWLTQG